MQPKFNRIAVLLRGELRAWEYAAEHIFKFVEQYSESTDYYFVTWNETRDYWYPEKKSQATKRPVIESDITEKFSGRNLINYKIINLPQYHNTFFYQAHLAKIANILKRRHELDNDFVYDQVIEIRPDLYIPTHITNTILACGDFEYSIGDLYIGYQCKVPSLPDICFRSNSFGNDVLGARNYQNKLNELLAFTDMPRLIPEYLSMMSTFDVHWMLFDYLYKRRLLAHPVGQHEFSMATVIRPNFPKNFAELTFAEIRMFFDEWPKIQWVDS